MSGKLKVNIVIAGRTYPLSVNNTKEEEGMRKAANDINKLIKMFEQNYAVSDKQDVLAMCALQYASKLEIASLQNTEDESEVVQKIDALTRTIASHLE